MRRTTDNEILRKYTPFILKTVRRFRVDSGLEWEDMVQIARLAFWQGWKRIGSPSALSAQNVLYLKNAIAYSLYDEIARREGTGKHRKVKPDKRESCRIISLEPQEQSLDIPDHSEKRTSFINLDSCDPYFAYTLRDWLSSITDKKERAIADMLISGYSIGEIQSAENICRDTIWRKRRSLRQSFADYVDIPRAAMGA